MIIEYIDEDGNEIFSRDFIQHPNRLDYITYAEITYYVSIITYDYDRNVITILLKK